MEKNMKLAEHFTLGEMTKTSTGLANVPNEAQVKNLIRVCSWLEMLRDEWNRRYSLPLSMVFTPPSVPPSSGDRNPPKEGSSKNLSTSANEKDDGDPIIITSAFRSPAVNKAVGGVSTSNHLTGCAADIRVAGIEEAIRKAVILLDISDESGEDFDELLIERNQRGSYWIHFAVRPPAQGNRRKVRFIYA